MKIHMEEGLQLIITPESYVEQVALSKWIETYQGTGGFLIESYAQHRVQADAGCALCGKGIGYHNDPAVGHQYQEPVAQPRR